MSAGPRGPTAGPDQAGPPAPDPREVLRDAAISEARSLAAYLSEGPMRTQPTLARVAMVLGQFANLVEAGAVVPALRDAAFQRLWTKYAALPQYDKAEWTAAFNEIWESPGAPPAARRAPTDAMIAAAAQAIGALLEEQGFVIRDGTYPPQLAEAALQAALAAARDGPA